MAERPPLDDHGVYDLLFAARRSLDGASGETVRGDTAIKTARRALGLLAVALVMAEGQDGDALPGVRD